MEEYECLRKDLLQIMENSHKISRSALSLLQAPRGELIPVFRAVSEILEAHGSLVTAILGLCAVDIPSAIKDSALPPNVRQEAEIVDSFLSHFNERLEQIAPLPDLSDDPRSDLNEAIQGCRGFIQTLRSNRLP